MLYCGSLVTLSRLFRGAGSGGYPRSRRQPELTSRHDLVLLVVGLLGFRDFAKLAVKGGRIGGKRRLETMTHEQRSAIGLKGARARWKKAKAKKL